MLLRFPTICFKIVIQGWIEKENRQIIVIDHGPDWMVPQTSSTIKSKKNPFLTVAFTQTVLTPSHSYQLTQTQSSEDSPERKVR
jgi:hypothetical protein